MTPNPIRKALSSMQRHGVRCLLMGGQACVLYGAAEFSRDLDLAVVAEAENLSRLESALEDLNATVIAVPPFEPRFLDLGLAVHFRCRQPGAEGLRIEVMSKLRGLDEFETLWGRRTTLELGDEQVEVLALPDLVRAKKTQRDKDWPMIARLVEANYFQNRVHPTAQQLSFWLLELRTPTLLMEVAGQHPSECRRLSKARPLLALALAGEETRLREALREEESREREADRQYWEPLRSLLEQLRGR